jgi:hypothetical protein
MIKKMSFAFNSNEVKNFVSSYTSFMNTNVSENINKSLTNCRAGNIADIIIGGGDCGRVQITGSNITLTQKAKATCDLTSQNTTELYKTITTETSNKIDDFLKQDTKAVQEFLSLGAIAFGINKSEFQKNLSTAITNSIREQTTNICESDFVATNKGTLNFCADISNTTLNLGQDATVTAITNCVNKILSKSVTSNSQLNEIFTKVDQAASTKQEGLGGFLRWFIIGAIIVGVIAIIILIIWFIPKGKGKSDTTQVSIKLPDTTTPPSVSPEAST